MSDYRSSNSSNIWLKAIVALLVPIIGAIANKVINDYIPSKSTSESPKVNNESTKSPDKNSGSGDSINNITINDNRNFSFREIIIYPSPNHSNNETPGSASIPVSPEKLIEVQDALVGTWEQQIYVNGWQRFGEFVVNKENGKYTMNAKQETLNPYSIKPLYIREVMYNGSIWTFNSYLQNGAVSNFKLNRISDKHFEGFAYSYAGGHQRDRWIKIE